MAHVTAAKLESCSTSEYARRQGFAVSALYYWQRKLNSKSVEREAGRTRQFMAPRVADAVTVPYPANCVLALPSGLALSMSALPAPEWLAAFARAVSGADASGMSYRTRLSVP